MTSALLRWSGAFMATHQWDHNAHHHSFLLRQLPARVGSALDVGCGTGEFARALARRADHVVGLDRHAPVVDRARATPSAATFEVGDLLTARGSYDVVSALAVVHHVPLGPALRHLRSLVRPGGTLLVLGLYREETRGDHLLSALAVPANVLVGAVRGSEERSTAPTAPSSETLAQVRAVAARELPGARIRRHLFWRYSLVWERSEADVDGVLADTVRQR